MPTGVIINSFAIIFGGILVALLGHHLSDNYKEEINLVFGLCSMGMGITSIQLMTNMPAVIFALVLGSSIGMALHLGRWINEGGLLMQKGVSKVFPNEDHNLAHEAYLANLLTVIVLFCASGTGIYGLLDAGISGNATILISKSILDFFTAAIFACQLGYVVSFVAIPQFIIFASLFYLSKLIIPLTSPTMLADFKACGGFLMLATGFRMIRLKNFPIAEMIPSMVIVMPLSWIWVHFIIPLLH
ncbi:hypothetical protein HMPREF9318_01299 [Streptococcus urinalis FB127-CNA-2]|uniref:Membrane protein n=1 Tax=Streptococcus urinalis 2285-97 TaxID=764291 RepID=G5KCM7_9STRE|nr:DUF554 domain-containing protein [Streptococcus urinalis]EHJ56058.1 putative membrane protein [Streptococcus urinalis 2285-97]EKS19777.1 hypothetical protein HMPREF9318_01299 [Streptococcus urinalis FB127-CNA-2]VEF31353.1 membrane protein [Streptococcus urinalis]